MKQLKLYVDMDGVLAEFRNLSNIEMLYEKNYFANLEPLKNVVDGVKELIEQVKGKNEIEIFILSSVLKDSHYARTEKNEWLDRNIPEIDAAHRIFLDYGQDKFSVIEEFDHNCVLLDDYTHNLQKWDEMGGISIKLLNPVNNRNHTWQGARIEHTLNPVLLAYTLKRLMVEEYVKRRNIKDYAKEAREMMKQQKIPTKDAVHQKAKGVTRGD